MPQHVRQTAGNQVSTCVIRYQLDTCACVCVCVCVRLFVSGSYIFSGDDEGKQRGQAPASELECSLTVEHWMLHMGPSERIMCLLTAFLSFVYFAR